MWPPWGKSPRRSAAPKSFAFSSFKDVQSLVDEKAGSGPGSENPSLKRASSVFHRVRLAAAALRAWSSPSSPLRWDSSAGVETDGEKKIVVYFTSLRVVRKTFEDCRAVRSILKGFRVSIDERDLSMDAGFLEELQGILGRHRKLALPRVFIGGKYVGGADEIRLMHETGELKKVIEGFPTEKGGVCESCGGVRFVLCYTCNGSHKCFLEKGGFRICQVCNENGILRCPSCCS